MPKTLRTVLLHAAAGVGIAACAHRPVVPPTPSLPPVVQIDPDLQALLANTVLHFDYDAATLNEKNRDRLTRIADYLRTHADTGVRISGNCDERGTEEYNLALGQRRADVARAYLMKLGVEGERVATVSYGKDKPTADDHDELAWAQNRRDEFQATDSTPRRDFVVAIDESDFR